MNQAALPVYIAPLIWRSIRGSFFFHFYFFIYFLDNIFCNNTLNHETICNKIRVFPKIATGMFFFLCIFFMNKGLTAPNLLLLCKLHVTLCIQKVCMAGLEVHYLHKSVSLECVSKLQCMTKWLIAISLQAPDKTFYLILSLTL